jgi:hypothetical protein
MGGLARPIHEPGNEAAGRGHSLISPASPAIMKAAPLLHHAPGHDQDALAGVV